MNQPYSLSNQRIPLLSFFPYSLIHSHLWNKGIRGVGGAIFVTKGIRLGLWFTKVQGKRISWTVQLPGKPNENFHPYTF